MSMSFGAEAEGAARASAGGEAIKATPEHTIDQGSGIQLTFLAASVAPVEPRSSSTYTWALPSPSLKPSAASIRAVSSPSVCALPWSQSEPQQDRLQDRPPAPSAERLQHEADESTGRGARLPGGKDERAHTGRIQKLVTELLQRRQRADVAFRSTRASKRPAPGYISRTHPAQPKRTWRAWQRGLCGRESAEGHIRKRLTKALPQELS
eukprot:scaffold3836_cov125-Isochrysis_galbana.AAC.2